MWSGAVLAEVGMWEAPGEVTDRNECVTGSWREGHPAGKQRRAWLNCPRVWNTDLVSDELG